MQVRHVGLGIGTRSYLDRRVELVLLCLRRRPEDGTPLPKRVGVL